MRLREQGTSAVFMPERTDLDQDLGGIDQIQCHGECRFGLLNRIVAANDQRQVRVLGQQFQRFVQFRLEALRTKPRRLT